MDECLYRKGHYCEILRKVVTPDECLACDSDLQKIVPKEYPGLITEIITYGAAVSGWIKAGRPTRTDEEVRDIHTIHCSKCNWYDPEQQRCKGCGCGVKAEGAALLNKIKMSTQHCPQQLW
jgi:hypothetical protein